MQIKELYHQGKQVVSLEMFPPKKDTDIAAIYAAVERMCGLAPDFISVTYGAGGGGNKGYTGDIAAVIQAHGVPSMAHLTCITATKDRIQSTLEGLAEAGVENILALRGDMPADSDFSISADYRYARDLVRDIRGRGDFCIGAGCYPEVHIECGSPEEDIIHLRQKQDAGADFFVSQLFFDNDFFLRFLDRARGAGVTLPIQAGVMPMLGRKQIERMIFMCGASLPSQIIRMLHQYENNPEDLRKAGIEYACRQLQGLLAAGVDGVHIYTMNKPDIAETCMRSIGRA